MVNISLLNKKKTFMQKEAPLWRRALGLLRRNPWIMHTVARMEYRHRIGIPFDRRYRPGLSGPPSNLALALTKQCNLHCIMCRQNCSDGEIPDNPSLRFQGLPPETWISLLDQVSHFKPWVYLTGGEPLLYPYFREVVAAAKKRHLTVHLQTNGTLLGKVADFLVESGVDAVTVSVDGPPAIHDRIRGRQGTFQRVAAGVEALVEARRRHNRLNPVLGFNCAISKPNARALVDITALAIGMQADVLQIQHTMFNSPENVACHNSLFTPERLSALGLSMALPSIGPGEYYRSELTQADVDDLKKGVVEAQNLALGKIKLVFMPNLPLDLLGSYYLNLKYPFAQGCDFFWKTFRVEADGSCSPCFNLLLGNIKEQSFAAIWNGPVIRNVRRLLTNKLYPGCVRCCHRSYLAGSRAF
jgi:MoaA/NifB/PqqE/SkfB family radical SAM enzyme